MKLLRATTFLFAAISIMGLVVMMNSCNRDKCKDVVCPVGRECFDGICICPAGFDGPNCDTISRERMLGNYFVSESCPSSGTTNYYSMISEGSSIEKITINNIVNSGLYAEANVTEFSIYVPSQNVGGIQIEDGTGTFYDNINPNQITLYLNYSVSGMLKQCTLTMIKQ